MNRTIRVTMAALAVMMVVGCGPSTKQKKLQADYTACQSTSVTLQGSLDSLTKHNAELQAQLGQAQAQAATLAAEQQKLQATHAQTMTNYDQVVSQLATEVQSGNLKIRQYQNMLSVDVAEKLFFASGSATLKPSGQQVLTKVGQALSQYPDKIIRVVGHTDNVPLGKGSAIASNWELSVLRATNVVRYLQDKCKIGPERLIASGRGPYEPVADNGTAEGRQKNRRIEIMLIDKSVLDTMSPGAGDSR